jgi:hypothetical protein
MKVKGSLANITAERVSSNLSPWSNLGRLVSFPMKERERRGLLRQRRPVAAMADLHGSPESSGFAVLDHQMTRNRHQSNAELNANTSTRFRRATTDRGWNAAWDGGDAIADSLELRKLTIPSTKNLKKSMGRKREGWQSHQCKEERRGFTDKLLTTYTRNSLGFWTDEAWFHKVWLKG